MLVIKNARAEKQDNGRWWVMHPSNDAILAYCDNETEARAVVNYFNAWPAMFEAVPRTSPTANRHLIEIPPMTREEALAAVAQGAVNITEGLTTIEPDSRVHRGMVRVCELATEDEADHARKRGTKIRESFLASVRANVNLLASMTADERRALAGGAKNLDANLYARITARALMVETWGEDAVDAALGGAS